MTTLIFTGLACPPTACHLINYSFASQTNINTIAIEANNFDDVSVVDIEVTDSITLIETRYIHIFVNFDSCLK